VLYKQKPTFIMITQKRIYLFLFVIALSLYACGGNEEAAAEQETTEQAEETTQSPQEAAQKAVEEMQKQMSGDGEAKEVIDFRKLKEQLPAELNGMERVSHTGEKVGAMGFKMSTAKAEYQDGERELEINLIDYAGLGMAKMGLAAWATAEVDRETDSGYERTTTINGYKAFEEYDRNTKNGKISILAGDRYIVTIEGQNVEEGAMREALEALDLATIMSLE
jgi:hypothetical protein